MSLGTARGSTPTRQAAPSTIGNAATRTAVPASNVRVLPDSLKSGGEKNPTAFGTKVFPPKPSDLDLCNGDIANAAAYSARLSLSFRLFNWRQQSLLLHHVLDLVSRLASRSGRQSERRKFGLIAIVVKTGTPEQQSTLPGIVVSFQCFSIPLSVSPTYSDVDNCGPSALTT